MTSSTPGDLTPQQREVLSRAIRVDQAGEVAANTIYEGQLLVLGRDPKYGPLIRVRLSVFFFSRQWLTTELRACVNKRRNISKL